MFLIGVDCATEAGKTGLARAEFDEENCRCRLLDVEMGSDVSSRLCEWIEKSEASPTLIALDTPLGWPQGFGSKLARHKAGQPLEKADRKTFFDRQTDRIVQEEAGKKALSVGSDKIARTSLVALKRLEEVRKKKRLDIPLAWTRNIQGVQAIEVYPAATLKVHEYPYQSYKDKEKQEHRKERIKILKKLSQHFEDGIKKRSHRKRMLGEPDALDAVVCILAGLDFLKGEARAPQDAEQRAKVKKEGWIWVKASEKGQ